MRNTTLTGAAICALAIGLAAAPAGASEADAVSFARDHAAALPYVGREASVRIINRAAGDVADDNAPMAFEAIASSGAERLMYFWPLGMVVRERLLITEDAVDLSRVAAGAVPFCRDHYTWSTEHRIGKMTEFRIEGGNLIGTGLVSRRPEVASIRMDMRDGIQSSVSLGYQILEYELDESDETKIPLLTVKKFRVFELSLVSMPADADAVIRSQFPQGAPPALEAAIRAASAVGATAARNAATPSNPGANMDPIVVTAPAPVDATRAVTPPVDTAAIQAAVVSERARATEIRAVAALTGVDEAATTAAVNAGTTVDAFRTQAIDGMAARQATITVTNPGLSPTDVRSAIIDAMASRITGAELTGPATQYRGLGIQEAASLIMGGRSYANDRRNPHDLAERALAVTSEFPNILSALANKILLTAYQAVPTAYQLIARRRDLNDFKATPVLSIGGFPRLEKIAEGGEISFGTIAEGAVAVKLETYGKRLGFTRQMIVNDDAGMFTDLASMAGATIAQQQSDIVFAVLAYHADLARAGGAGYAGTLLKNGVAGNTGDFDLNVAGLSYARKTMRSRKRLDGVTSANAQARFLVTGADLETAAEQLVTGGQFAPGTVGEINPFFGKLQIVTDGGIEGNDWFTLADPALTPSLVFGSLAGRTGPMVSQNAVVGYDGLEFQVLIDFYAAAVSDQGIFGGLQDLVA